MRENHLCIFFYINLAWRIGRTLESTRKTGIWRHISNCDVMLLCDHVTRRVPIHWLVKGWRWRWLSYIQKHFVRLNNQRIPSLFHPDVSFHLFLFFHGVNERLSLLLSTENHPNFGSHACLTSTRPKEKLRPSGQPKKGILEEEKSSTRTPWKNQHYLVPFGGRPHDHDGAEGTTWRARDSGHVRRLARRPALGLRIVGDQTAKLFKLIWFGLLRDISAACDTRRQWQVILLLASPTKWRSW